MNSLRGGTGASNKMARGFCFTGRQTELEKKKKNKTIQGSSDVILCCSRDLKNTIMVGN